LILDIDQINGGFTGQLQIHGQDGSGNSFTERIPIATLVPNPAYGVGVDGSPVPRSYSRSGTQISAALDGGGETYDIQIKYLGGA